MLNFDKLKKEVNERYYKKYCPKLGNLSSAEKSRNVIRFSGISKKMLFVDVFYYRGAYIHRGLPKGYDFLKKERSAYESYVVLLNENGTIKKIVPIALRYQ